MRGSVWIWVPLLIVGALVGWRVQANKAVASAAAQQQGQRRGAAPAVELATAGPADIDEVVEAVGSAESPTRVELASKVSGRIAMLSVREGDVVRKGATLVQIDSSEQQALVLQAQANLAEAESKLAQAQMGSTPNSVGIESAIEQRQAELTSAKATLDQVQKSVDATIASAREALTQAQTSEKAAEIDVQNAKAKLASQRTTLRNFEQKLARMESLFKEGFTSTQALEDARSAVETQKASVEVAQGDVNAAQADWDGAKARVRAQENQVALVQRKAQADLTAAKADADRAAAVYKAATSNRAQTGAYQKSIQALQSSVEAARAQLEQARARLRDLNLVTPIDGTVTERNGDVGSVASAGQKVLVVQSLDALDVTASLPLDQESVTVGQSARLTFDALPGEEFQGVIAYVNPAADTRSRQYGIRIRVANERGKIRPGMFARVTIQIAKTRATVAVPKEAIRSGKKGSTVTVVADDMMASVVPVTLGKSDGKLVQVLSGVQAGQRVVSLTFQPIKDGQKVTEAKPKEKPSQ